MKEIELVIKMPEKTINEIKDNAMFAGSISSEILWYVTNAIVNSTPLPKGHGRLVDADELYDGFIDGTEGYDCQTWSRIEIGDIIENAPTIIEADKESEDRE